MKHRPASTRGFALVIALSLMAFILLLILSITTLVRVESQSANIQLAQLEARMNAQLGAMVALGDLQRYTGPDQRVTARSDILLAPNASGIAGQSRWTGVWSSKDSDPNEAGYQFDSTDQDDGLADHKARWLVSGNGSDPNASTLNPNEGVTGETIELATIGGSVTNKSNQDDTVKAPKVEILGENNVPAGHYAYWVRDEGVKARVNMVDPHLGSAAPGDEYYRTAMAQVADPTAVSNSDGEQLLTGTSSRWKDESQDPGKISSLKNIPMFLKDDLGGVDLRNVSREFFHDFTVHSSGVLANTKDGGLKRDLSTALLDLPDDMSSGGANSPIFPPANKTSGPAEMDPGGPKWEQLANYYRMASGLPLLDINGNKVDDSVLPETGPINLRMPTNEQGDFTPVVTRSNFFVYGFADRNPAREASNSDFNGDSINEEWCLDTTGRGRGQTNSDWLEGDWYYARGYRYSLGMFPLITLWNPYDRAMALNDLGLEFELKPMNIVSTDGAVIAKLGQHTSKFNGAEVNRNTVRFVIRGITLAAGEAVNFSPPCNSYYDKNNPSNNVLVARASAPYVNGFFTPATLPDDPLSEEIFWGRSNGSPNVQQRWVISGKSAPSRLTLQFANEGNMWRQLVMLYSSTDLINSQFRSENRFKAIDIKATGVFQNPWQQPRVILNDRLMGMDINDKFAEHIKLGASNQFYRDPFTFINSSSSGTSYFDDFVGPVGDSAKPSPQGSTDLIEGRQLSSQGTGLRVPWGAYATMRFPDVPNMSFANKNKEHKMHLFLNTNPTAPVIDKEPNITWTMDALGNQEEKGMAELNVYSKWHLMPWAPKGEADRFRFYDEVIAAGTDTIEAYVGLSNTQIDGSKQAVLFEVPDNIPLSIGQLANANLMNHDVFSFDETRPAIGNVINGNGWNSHTLQSYATPTYAIGNSIASPFLKLDRTEQWFSSVRKANGAPAATYDYSYKLNDALWDEYFFSGITDADLTFPLPNSRLTRTNAFSTDSDLTTENRASANLLLDGAFNINSTSVAAWEAVLGAMRDIETKGYFKDTTLRHNFARFSEPPMGLATVKESVPEHSNKDLLAAGYRNLTDAQITNLASKIVDEIRLRSATPDKNGNKYPFLSLSEFINRSPQRATNTGVAPDGQPIKTFAWRGALQAAIDKANLNGLESDNTGLWAESAEYPLYYENSGDTPVVDRPKADGMLGSFMQSDLLAKIGAFIQARSDTFTIRSFGSSREQFGSNEGSLAYYEMVVQRVPDYVDLGDKAYEDPAPLSTNQKFGRRYEIKSQRWVNQDEI